MLRRCCLSSFLRSSSHQSIDRSFDQYSFQKQRLHRLPVFKRISKDYSAALPSLFDNTSQTNSSTTASTLSPANQPIPSRTLHLERTTPRNKTMGLLKSGMKYGGLAYAARSIGKGVAAHEENKAATASTKPTTIAAHGQYNRQQPQQGYPQGPPPYEAANGFGELHASWCDASCGGRCSRGRIG
jgi:hypothetical protein